MNGLVVCREGHEEIAYIGGDILSCPLCLLKNRLEDSVETIKKMQDETAKLRNKLRKIKKRNNTTEKL